MLQWSTIKIWFKNSYWDANGALAGSASPCMLLVHLYRRMESFFPCHVLWQEFGISSHHQANVVLHDFHRCFHITFHPENLKSSNWIKFRLDKKSSWRETACIRPYGRVAPAASSFLGFLGSSLDFFVGFSLAIRNLIKPEAILRDSDGRVLLMSQTPSWKQAY